MVTRGPVVQFVVKWVPELREGIVYYRDCWPESLQHKTVIHIISIAFWVAVFGKGVQRVVYGRDGCGQGGFSREVFGRGGDRRCLFGGCTAKRWFDECKPAYQVLQTAVRLCDTHATTDRYSPCTVTSYSCSSLLRPSYTCCHRGLSGL